MHFQWKDLASWGSWASATVALFATIAGWRFAKAYDRRLWHNQKLTEKRIQLLEQAGPMLNDLYCYFVEVGSWKETAPPDLIKKKRALDRLMGINRFLFSQELWSAYQAFMHAYFKTYTGYGEDAKLRMFETNKKRLPNWNEDWSVCFCKDKVDVTTVENLKKLHHTLLRACAHEIGITQQ